MLGLAFPASASAQGIEEFPLAAGTDPAFITTGHDGRLWFANNGAAQIGRIGTNGLQLAPIAAAPNPIDIAAGPAEGMYWTTPSQIQGRSATGFALSTAVGNPETAYALAASGTTLYTTRLVRFYPDIWAATARYSSGLGTTGSIGTVGIAPSTLSGPRLTDVTVGPDNKLWYALYEGGSILRGLLAGSADLRVDLSAGSLPYRIAVGPDGAMWFTEYGGNRIGRITTGGVVSEFDLPRPGVGPNDIVAGPDGALWFTEYKDSGNAIGRITTDGKVTEYAIPTANSRPWGIAAGPDGKIWFTESATDKIGRLDPAKAVPIGGRGGGGGGPRGGGPGADRTKPTFQGRVTISRRRFSVGGVTEFRFNLSEPARVTVKIERKLRGRRVRGRCRAKARTGRRCTLWKSAGRSLVRQGLQGPNSIAFSGRLGRKALALGSYRALITATDAAGNRSRTAKLGFTIVRKARR
jgi:virginiamycin B lyase